MKRARRERSPRASQRTAGAGDAGEPPARRDEMLRRALDAADVGVWEWRPDSDAVHADERFFALLGHAPGGPVTGAELFSHVHKDGQEPLCQAVEAALAKEAFFHHSTSITRPDTGETRWVVLRGAHSRADGAARLIGVAFDITLRRQAVERQRELLAELDHRVKNILASVSAIAHRTRKTSTTIDGFLAALDGRVRAMAVSHSLLSAARWEGASLRHLIEELLAPHVPPQRRAVTVRGPELLLAPKAVQSLGLALHELIANAATHGALSAPGGRVAVSWRLEGRQVRLAWRERGGPAVVAPSGTGFGLMVLQDMLVRDIGAEVSCDFQRDGMECTLAFPAGYTSADDGTSRSAAAEARPAPDVARARRLAPGRRILVVEDAWAVGLQLKTILEALGHEVVGPATGPDEALALAEADGLEAAVLDIRLEDRDSFPVADRLRDRGIPFGFASGYSDARMIPPRFRDIPRISKPYSEGAIEELLGRLFG